MITQRLMAPGNFDLQLDPGTPERFLDWPLWSHVMILPQRLGARSTVSDGFIKTLPALYTGVVTERPDRFRLRGHDLSWWWMPPHGPDTQNAQRFVRYMTDAPTVETWLDEVTDGSPNGLTKGTYNGTGLATPVVGRYWGVTLLEVLDHVCLRAGAEWRVNPDGSIDVAAPTILHRHTPQLLISDRIGPIRSANLRSLELVSADIGGDATDVMTRYELYREGRHIIGGFLAPIGAAQVAWGSTAPIRHFKYEMNQEDASDALGASIAMLGQRRSSRMVISATSKEFAAARLARPGDWIYVDAERRGVKDPAEQVVFGGQTMSPARLRLYDLTWPCRDVGVLLRRGVDDWIDITPYVIPEAGDAKFGVGRPEPRLSGGIGPGVSMGLIGGAETSGSAVAGAQINVSQWSVGAVTTAPNLGTTPTITNTIATTNGVAIGHLYFEWGGTGMNNGSGAYVIQFPAGFAPDPSLPLSQQIGTGFVRRSATDTAVQVILQANGQMRIPGVANTVGSSVPWSWGTAGDRISLSVMYLVGS